MAANMAGLFATLAEESSDGHTLSGGDVRAAVVPSCPDRSVVNSVVYSTAESLADQLPRLAEEYERAGVRAWTVWVPEWDERAGATLAGAGHVLDAQPAAMVRSLDHLPEADGAPLDLMDPDMVECARVNDASYGFDGDFEGAFRSVPPEPARLYLARADGQPAATLLTYEAGSECGVYLVATLPEARGRGLATALVSHALREARARGCETTSLQATARGRRVYERLGYRSIGAAQMWERRQPL
jgi:GNAT superfamily N-acetyltransferase